MTTEQMIEQVALAMQKARDEIGATEAQRIAFAYAEAAMRATLEASRPVEALPLPLQILAALGGVRNDMPPDDVAAVQRFVSRINALPKQDDGG